MISDAYDQQEQSLLALGGGWEIVTPSDAEDLPTKYKYILCGATAGAVSCLDRTGALGHFYCQAGQPLPVRPTRILDAGLSEPGAITQGATGPEISVARYADDAYDFVIEITLGGELGAGEFRWSLDGGSTWEDEDVVLPESGEYALGTTGLTVTFAAGAYVLTETYEWSTPAPIATTATPLIGVF